MNKIVPASNVTVIEPNRVQSTQAQQAKNIGAKLAEARGGANSNSFGEALSAIGQRIAADLPIFNHQVSTETIANKSWEALGAVLS